MLVCIVASLAAAACVRSGVAPQAVLAGNPIKQQNPVLEPPQKIIVARVNSAEIRMDSLVSMMNRVASQQGAAMGTPEEIRKKAMDFLILQELAYQKAVKDGLQPGPAELDQMVADLKQKLESEEAYQQFLATQGITEEAFRAQSAKDRAIERIAAREVFSKVVVPEIDLRAEYERVKSKYIAPEKLLAVDVKFPGDPQSQTMIKKAEGVLKQIRKDPKKDPWKLVLDGTFLATTVEIKKDREKELYDAAKKLKPGMLSGVIRSRDALHIVKLEEYRPERQMTFDELKPVLLRTLAGPYEEKRLLEWGEELKKTAAIEIIETVPGVKLPQEKKTP
jgi:parvulin-like peptidyl-prolyl isomerase